MKEKKKKKNESTFYFYESRKGREKIKQKRSILTSPLE